MSVLLIQSWCEFADEIALQCDVSYNQNAEDVQVILRQFIELVSNVPESIQPYFRLEDPVHAQALVTSNTAETLLFTLCRNVAVSVSCDDEGSATATIRIAGLEIEQSFTNRASLPLALVGAIILTALSIIERRGELKYILN